MAPISPTAFGHGLSQHGYAFQQRVIDETKRVAAAMPLGFRWRTLVVECPVALAGGRHTRVDFILEYVDPGGRGLHLLIAECKRVNPAFSTWCFAPASFVEPSWLGEQVVAENLVLMDGTRESAVSSGIQGASPGNVFHIGFPLKTGHGDAHPIGSDKDAIEEACSQVSRGLNGFVASILGDERLYRLIERHTFIRLLPAVFTTARLNTTNADLRDTDIVTGNIELKSAPKEQDWLFYQYPQSPGIKHSVPRGALRHETFADLVARDFVRSIAIVGPTGIRDFLVHGWLRFNDSDIPTD